MILVDEDGKVNLGTLTNNKPVYIRTFFTIWLTELLHKIIEHKLIPTSELISYLHSRIELCKELD